jgi:hypothetical protein
VNRIDASARSGSCLKSWRCTIVEEDRNALVNLSPVDRSRPAPALIQRLVRESGA